MYFTFVKQQFSRAFWLMIVAVAVAKLGYIGIDEPNLVKKNGCKNLNCIFFRKLASNLITAIFNNIIFSFPQSNG